MERKTEDRRIIWIDLETTGDDPNTDHILEVGWMITDYYDIANVLDEGTGRVIQQVWPVEPMITVPAVMEMHTRSGLLDDLNNPDHHKVSLVAMEAEIVMAMQDLTLEDAEGNPVTTWVLGGSGVSQLDAHFIRRHMPLLHAAMTYYYIDIGQVRRFLRDMVEFTMGPEASDHYRLVREIGHRAHDDIKAHHMEAVLIRDELKGRLISPTFGDF